MIIRRKTTGDSGLEALRILKRRLSDVVYQRYAPTSLPRSNPEPLDRGASDSPAEHDDHGGYGELSGGGQAWVTSIWVPTQWVICPVGPRSGEIDTSFQNGDPSLR